MDEDRIYCSLESPKIQTMNNNTASFCQCDFRKGDASGNGWKCHECGKEINNTAEQDDDLDDDGGMGYVGAIAQYRRDHPQPPEPASPSSDAIAFAQWLGKNRYVMDRKGEWFDNRLHTVANSTTQLYQLFKSQPPKQ